MSRVVRCKLQLHSINPASQDDTTGATVRFGAVWEGSTEKQQASENAVFGKWTPMASFEATIFNPAALAGLEVGKQYYFDITEAPAG